MADVIPRTRVTYFAPTARKHFQSMRAAAQAEARAMLRRKYPTEQGDENGGGWHWSNDDRLVLVFARLWRAIYRAGRSRTRTEGETSHD